MGGSESKPKEELEYNLLKDHVQQWDEENQTAQLEQIESFHKSILMRSQESFIKPGSFTENQPY